MALQHSPFHSLKKKGYDLARTTHHCHTVLVWHLYDSSSKACLLLSLSRTSFPIEEGKVGRKNFAKDERQEHGGVSFKGR